MLPILADNSTELVLRLEAQLAHKGVKKRLHKIAKKIDLDFHLTMPILIALSIIKTCDAKLNAQTKFKVLIHQLNKHDCIDHLRWAALVPALLGKPELELEVVGINSTEIEDNVSNARALIDFIIEKEDLKGTFISSLYLADIDDLDDLSTFDVIINNNASPVELLKLSDSKIMGLIVENNIPYVLFDFTQGILLNNYNLLRNKGFSSNGNLIENNFATTFRATLNGTEYGHARYMLPINSQVEHCGQITDIVFANYLSALKVRLDHGDNLYINQIAKPLTNNKVQLFPNVVLNTKECTATVNYLGDLYTLNVHPIFTVVPKDLNTLDSNADKLLWAIYVYQELLLEIISKKEKSA